MILASIKAPKGNVGMTLFGTHNDDTTDHLPDIGFDFTYADVNVRANIYTSGNSWVGLGSGTMHLCINQRDASYNNLYWIKEIENNRPVFRIRWEGQGTYSSWGANNLIWELILYNDNAMVLVIVATPKSGTDSFVSQGSSGTISCNFQVGKSYVFVPTQVGGKSYTVQEGSYTQVTQKFLMDDGGNGIKAWDGNAWTKVADAPVTESIITTNGVNTLPYSRNGLILTNPTLLMWTDDLSGIGHKIKATALPTPKLIKQITPYLIPTGISNVVIDINLTGSSIIKVICSVDGGVTWKAWNGTSWIVVNVSAIDNVKTNGMLPSTISSITTAQWLLLVGAEQTIKFGYYMEQVDINDSCNINKIRANYK